MCPTGTAVLGDVLVSNVGEIIHTVDVVPNPGVWKGDLGKWLSQNWLNWATMLLSAGTILSDGNSKKESNDN